MTSRFESHDLNTMIDLVDAGDPQALEAAGRALLGVRAAFHGAAGELRGHLAGVEWKGESADGFRRFGARLAEHADELGEYALRVGAELKEASAGLTSVRNSLPPKDGSPATGTLPSEPHRQEAVNQLNRLASYYRVSTDRLAAEHPPVFEEHLTADVPRPSGEGGGGTTPGEGTRAAPGEGSGTSPGDGSRPAPGSANGARPGAGYGAWYATGHEPGTEPTGTTLPPPPPPPHPPSATSPPETLPTPPDPTTPLGPRTAAPDTPAHAPTTMELNTVASQPPASAPVAPAALAAHTQPPVGTPATGWAGPAFGVPGGISGGIPLPPPPLGGTPGIPGQGPVSASGVTGGSGRPAPTGTYGVTGGTPARTAAAPRGGTFTQGGAGLVRPAAPAMTSAIPPQGNATRPNRTGHTPTTASPLTEDEETWTSAQPAAAPPVVTHVPTHPH